MSLKLRRFKKDLTTAFNAAKGSPKTETVKAEHVLFFYMETQIHVFHCYLKLQCSKCTGEIGKDDKNF